VRQFRIVAGNADPAAADLAARAGPISDVPGSDLHLLDFRRARCGWADRAVRQGVEFADLALDNRSFSGYPVDGNFIGASRSFQVRFGTENGEQRAYFTETAATTICDIQVSGGQLLILPTNKTVPGGG
jgi:hypothetical protein